MKTLRFKSNPANWRKEFLGLKCNTVRNVESNDPRKEILDEYLDRQTQMIAVEITNTGTQEVFRRIVTDVTFWENVYIISWQHQWR